MSRGNLAHRCRRLPKYWGGHTPAAPNVICQSHMPTLKHTPTPTPTPTSSPTPSPSPTLTPTTTPTPKHPHPPGAASSDYSRRPLSARLAAADSRPTPTWGGMSSGRQWRQSTTPALTEPRPYSRCRGDTGSQGQFCTRMILAPWTSGWRKSWRKIHRPGCRMQSSLWRTLQLPQITNYQTSEPRRLSKARALYTI